MLVIGIFEAIGRRASLALPGGIVFSLAVPGLSALAGPYLQAFVVGTLAMALVRIDLARTLDQWRRPDRITLALAFLMVAMPLGLAWLGPAMGLPAVLVVALVLLAASPPLASGANFALVLGLDAELAVNLVLAGTLMVPLAAPPLILHALDLGLDLDAVRMLRRLAVTVGLAVVFAAVIRWLAGRDRIVRRAKMFDGIATTWMILFLVAIMDGVPALAATDPAGATMLFLVAVVANFGFPLVVLALGLFVSATEKKEAAVAFATVAMFAGNRNIGLMLTALPAPLYAQVGPFVALYQIPVYLTLLIMGPVFAGFIRCRMPRSET